MALNLQKEITQINTNVAYIRARLDEAMERAKEDRNLSLAHFEEDDLNFKELNSRVNRISGGIGVVAFLITAGAAVAALLMP